MIDLNTLPSLKEIIQRFELEPKKSLGQNFILNPEILRKIARLVPNLSERHVLEIGPGPGGLTRALLELGALKVTAIEMDRRCLPALDELSAVVSGRLAIVEGDALTLNLQTLAPDAHAIVANLPYYISTRLLTDWCAYLNHFDCLVLMFQKEVAKRICAKPGNKDYGRLSIVVQALAEASIAFDLPPGAFTPPPKITSSVVMIKPHKNPPFALDLSTLEKITQQAFGQRRKMLKSSLRAMSDDIVTDLENLEIDPTLRAEDVSVEDYCRLSQKFKSPTSKM